MKNKTVIHVEGLGVGGVERDLPGELGLEGLVLHRDRLDVGDASVGSAALEVLLREALEGEERGVRASLIRTG